MSVQQQTREITCCYIAGARRTPVHSGLGGCKGEGLPPSVFLVPVSAASELTGKSRERGLRNRKKRSPFLEGETYFKSI